jgi:hypothetical protein
MNPYNQTNPWADFNDAQNQQSYDVIPKGTLARVRMTIKPGGFDSAEHGWTGGYATRSDKTDSVYLNAEFVITDGEFTRRKVWSLIGLYSPKGPDWGNIGRAFVRAILNSSRNLHPQDNGQQAAAARRIQGFADLDGIEFLAKIDVEQDQNGQPKNVIKVAIQPDHKDYARLMGVAARPPTEPGSSPPAAQAPLPPVSQPAVPPRAPQPATSGVPGRPSWAQ